MTSEWGKLITAICDQSSVWLTFLVTNRPVLRVFVKIGPTPCARTIVSDLYYVKNVNEELLNFVRATLVTILMTAN